MAPGKSLLAMFSKMVDAQAVMLATNEFYAMATGLMLVFAAVVWLAKRPKGPLKAGESLTTSQEVLGLSQNWACHRTGGDRADH